MILNQYFQATVVPTIVATKAVLQTAVLIYQPMQVRKGWRAALLAQLHGMEVRPKCQKVAQPK